MCVNLRVTWEVSWELAWEGSPELGILEQTWLPEWKEVCLPSWALRLCQLSSFSEFWMACECFGHVSRTKKKITLLSFPYLRTFFSQLSKSRRRGGMEYSISPPHKSCFFFFTFLGGYIGVENPSLILETPWLDLCPQCFLTQNWGSNSQDYLNFSLWLQISGRYVIDVPLSLTIYKSIPGERGTCRSVVLSWWFH